MSFDLSEILLSILVVLLSIVIALQRAEIRRLELWLNMMDEYDVSEQSKEHWME